MQIREAWVERNLTLRQMGLPVLEDAQHAALEAMPVLAKQFDQLTTAFLQKKEDVELSLTFACRDPSMRWIAAMLGEVAWRNPAVSPDLHLDQSALLEQMKLIDRDTLQVAKARPVGPVFLYAGPA